VRKLGEGAYGTVFLAVDMKPKGGKRKIDKKHLDLLDKVATEGKSQYGEDTPMTEEQKLAVQTLGNKEIIFT